MCTDHSQGSLMFMHTHVSNSDETFPQGTVSAKSAIPFDILI